MVPEGLRVKINKGTWPVLPIFDLLKKVGNLEESGMYNTFNMGIGMVLAIPAEDAEKVLDFLNQEEKQAYMIGEIIEGKAGVDIC